jgi:formate/nitrite transporter FocA (FNT family)
LRGESARPLICIAFPFITFISLQFDHVVLELLEIFPELPGFIVEYGLLGLQQPHVFIAARLEAVAQSLLGHRFLHSGKLLLQL